LHTSRKREFASRFLLPADAPIHSRLPPVIRYFLIFACKSPRAKSLQPPEPTMDTELLGYAAGILTTIAFLPQAFQMIRTRQARDVSMTWAATMTAGVFLWLCYGIMKHSLPMILANCVTLLLLFIILFFKIRDQGNSGS
jgi:MtN3 and saliva related transmembrane protein